jgi:8-oxo-dGTP pyrophosphatase MutT (NUDIX family)
VSLSLDIAACVEGYQPFGDEASYVIAIDALASGRDMAVRSEFDPGHFTASGFVASPDRLSLLLIEHAKLGRWLQPGGHMELGDPSVEEAARREIAEETGIASLSRVGTTLVRIDTHEIPPHGGEPGHIHIDLGIGFISHTAEIGPIDEVLDARWVPFDELAWFGLDAAGIGGAEGLLRLIDGE